MEELNEQEFLKIVADNNRIIYKICYMYAKDDDEVKDLYQEVVAQLWRGYKSYRGDCKLSSWIYRVGINVCVSNYRREKKHQLDVPLLDNDGFEDNSHEHIDQLKELYRLINLLDPLEKALILLWLDEKKYEEISDITGISRNNVASKLKRAKEKLSKLSNE